MEATVAIAFMAACMFLPMLFSALIKVETPHIFYVENNSYQYNDNRRYYNTPKKKKLTVKNTEEPILDEQELKLIDDCIQALINLGVKKTDAGTKVRKMFQNKKYITVEEFLLDAFKS